MELKVMCKKPDESFTKLKWYIVRNGNFYQFEICDDFCNVCDFVYLLSDGYFYDEDKILRRLKLEAIDVAKRRC